MPGIETRSFQGHQMVKVPDLGIWASRAPFTQIDWQSNTLRLHQEGRRFGVLVEIRVGNEPRYSLHSLATLKNLRDTLGHDRVPENFGAATGGRNIVFNEDVTVVGFEFFILEGLALDRLTHPVTRMTQTHAQAMCLVIGADLMTDVQYEAITTNHGKRKHATPTGELFGPNEEEYVVSSIRSRRQGPDSVENPERPDDGVFGVRDYTGNVGKWTKRNPQEEYQFGFRDGSCFDDGAEFFSGRGGYGPGVYGDVVGFLAAAPA